ncbi:saccharopine dehydrogenase NADP-binding domain-containing protein [Humidesulfovibrio idahonensis]
MKTFVLLGGYGGAGQELSRLLLRETDAELVLAGRDTAKAARLAAALNGERPGRARAARADARDPASLAAVLRGSALLIDLTPGGGHVGGLARAALDAGADYLDIHFQLGALEQLLPLAQDFERAGRLLLTQAGCHPGLPAALVRAAAPFFDEYRSALVGMGLSMRVENETTALELVDELMTAEGTIFADGAWRKAGNRDMRALDLGPRFGVRQCFPMRMAELESLPGALGLRECGVLVAGFNPVADWFVLPLILLCGRLGLIRMRPLLARLFTWSINTFSKDAPGMSFALAATGARQGAPASLRLVVDHPSPYALTAIPVAACLRQYLAGGLCAPGLRFMGQVADPRRLLDDMARMGVRVDWSRQPD